MPTATLPIGMLKQESMPMNERGYTCVPDDWDYDPSSQVSSLYRMGGKTEPTTNSLVANTTGVINSDSDESNDDKGTD
jgi:hypothetical protein